MRYSTSVSVLFYKPGNLYSRYEKGRRRRTSDVYRDKVFEWTLNGRLSKLALKKPTNGDDHMIQVLRARHCSAACPRMLQSSSNNIHLLKKGVSEMAYRRRISV